MEPSVLADLQALREDIHHNTDLIDNLAVLKFLKDVQDHWFAQQDEFVVPVLPPQPRKRSNRTVIVAAFVPLLPLLPLLQSL